MARLNVGWGKKGRPFTKEEYKLSSIKKYWGLSYSKYMDIYKKGLKRSKVSKKK